MDVGGRPASPRKFSPDLELVRREQLQGEGCSVLGCPHPLRVIKRVAREHVVRNPVHHDGIHPHMFGCTQGPEALHIQGVGVPVVALEETHDRRAWTLDNLAPRRDPPEANAGSRGIVGIEPQARQPPRPIGCDTRVPNEGVRRAANLWAWLERWSVFSVLVGVYLRGNHDVAKLNPLVDPGSHTYVDKRTRL